MSTLLDLVAQFLSQHAIAITISCAVVVVSYAAICFNRKIREIAKEQSGFCSRCGFDLRASDQCPECGHFEQRGIEIRRVLRPRAIQGKLYVRGRQRLSRLIVAVGVVVVGVTVQILSQFVCSPAFRTRVPPQTIVRMRFQIKLFRLASDLPGVPMPSSADDMASMPGATLVMCNNIDIDSKRTIRVPVKCVGGEREMVLNMSLDEGLGIRFDVVFGKDALGGGVRTETSEDQKLTQVWIGPNGCATQGEYFVFYACDE